MTFYIANALHNCLFADKIENYSDLNHFSILSTKLNFSSNFIRAKNRYGIPISSKKKTTIPVIVSQPFY